MQFVIERNDLLNGLNLVSRAIAAKSTLPILTCILITADGNGIKMTANNLELCIETAYIEAQVKSHGIVALESRLFSDIVRKLPDDYVTVTVNEENACKIKSGKSEFKVLGLDGSEFPTIPEVEKTNEYIFSQTYIRNMIKGTVFSVALDGAKQVLTGELFEIKNGFFTMVAVDGFRVSLKKLKLKDTSQNIEIVIPGKTSNELIKIFTGGDDDYVKFYFSDKHILFEIESCIVVSRLLDGDFLKYETVVNTESQMTFRVERLKLLSGIERVALISGDDKRVPVKFSIMDDCITISSNAQIGTAHDEVEGVMQGEPLEIAFNPKYFTEALKVIEDEEILLNFTTALSPCIIKSVSGDGDYTYLVLPLRIKK